MNAKIFNIIVFIVLLLLIGLLIYMGYTFKKCPPPIISTPQEYPHHVDTFYKEKIPKKNIYEKNPYIPVAISDTVAVFDSIAKYYGR